MTIKEIQHSLPNGFHDSELNKIEIDYVKREIKLHIDVNISDYGKTTESEFRKGLLTVTGFHYCAIDPPSSSYPYKKAEGQWMDNFYQVSNSPDEKFVLEKLPDNLPENTFVIRSFIFDWNSYLYLAATDAHFEWLSNEI